MSWNRTTKIMSTPIGWGDISQAVSYDSGDLGDLIQNGVIIWGAKYKPFRNTVKGFSSDLAWESALEIANYGLSVPVCSEATLLASAVEYVRPNGTTHWYRSLDFKHYYGGAPDFPAYCTAIDPIVVNIINQLSFSPAAFFVYHKEGYLKDCLPSVSGGCDRAESAGRSATQISYCLAVGEVKTNEGTLLTSLSSPYLGIALFDDDNHFVGFAGCQHQLVAVQADSRDNDMIVLRVSDFPRIALGDYKGKPCIRFSSPLGSGYQYVPLKNRLYTVKYGGANLYSYIRRGLSTSNEASSVHDITTNLSTVYITIRVTNNSGMEHFSTRAGWTLLVDITGTVDGQQINPNTRRLSPTVENISISSGGTVDLIFKCDSIWEEQPTISPQIHESGEIAFIAQLVYSIGGEDTEFNSAPFQPALTATYSNP